LREALRAARPAIERYDLIVRVKRGISKSDIASAATEGAMLIDRLLADKP
jgi:hypothetical protein